jgi:YesN/AraC family two-component response regulator
MELSLLCESKIFLCIVDKVEKLTLYCSESNINTFLVTYIQKLNQNKLPHKDILSNNDYKSLFSVNHTPEIDVNSNVLDNGHQSNEANAKEDKDMLDNNLSAKSKFYNIKEYDSKANDIKNEFTFDLEQQYDTQPAFMNNNNEKENELNLFVNSNDSVINDLEENSSMNNKRLFFKEECALDNFNPLFQSNTLTSTDNNSNCSPNLFKSCFKGNNTKDTQSSNSNQKQNKRVNNQSSFNYPMNNTNNKHDNLNQKHRREDNTNNNHYSLNINKDIYNTDTQTMNNTINNKFNLSLLNKDNIANLKAIIPNLNFLSNNMGVINWVIPGDFMKNNVNNEQKSDKL